MADELPFMRSLLRALGKRLQNTPMRQHLVGGWAVGDTPARPEDDQQPRPEMPYMVILPVDETPTEYTNRAKTSLLKIAFQVAAREFDEVQSVIALLLRWVQNAPLVFDDALEIEQSMTLTKLRQGNIEYGKEAKLDEWEVIVYYEAEMRQRTLHTPPS